MFSENYKPVGPVPVAARSRAKLCVRSPTEIAGSNPTRGEGIGYLSVVSVLCCHVEVSVLG